jgi:hypothetical protein
MESLAIIAVSYTALTVNCVEELRENKAIYAKILTIN